VTSTDGNIAGGWAVNTSAGRPVLEATAVVARFLGFSRLIIGDDLPDARRAREWIIANQNSDGGWGSFQGQESRIWLSAMAIRALLEFNLHDPVVMAGVEWLLRNRDPSNEAWGERPGASATVTHTAFVLSALVDSKLAEVNKNVDYGIRTGYSWLADNLLATNIFDDSARVESYNVSYRESGTAVTWQNAIWHSGLPYALSALVRQPDGPDASLLSKSIETIVAGQLPDGRWPNADSAAGISVWAVWPFLDAFADVLHISPVRRGDQVRWITADTMLISRGSDRGKTLRKIVLRSQIGLLRRLAVRHWASALLTLVLLTGAGLAIDGLLGWSEFGFALVVPIFLLSVQELMARNR